MKFFLFTITLIQALSSSTGAAQDSTDYYALLNVAKEATTSQLKSAYRQRSLQLHPDKNPNDPDAQHKFQELQKAYEVLKDPDSRVAYDSYGTLWMELKKYKEDYLQSVEMERFIQGGRMYVKEVKVEIEEMFWGKPGITILHPSWVDDVIAGFDGIWVVFFGNPKCGPCKAAAPKISQFAVMQKDNPKIQVATVNMGVHGNHLIYERVSPNSNSIPKIALLLPKQGRERWDYEIFQFNAYDNSLNGQRNFMSQLQQQCQRLLDSAIETLPAQLLQVGPSWRNALVAASSSWLMPGTPPTIWLIWLTVENCQLCSEYEPVLRRSVGRMAKSNSNVAVRRHLCHSVRDWGLCNLAQNQFPALILYNAIEGTVNEVDLHGSIQRVSQDSQEYGYRPHEFAFSSFLDTISELHNGKEKNVGKLANQESNKGGWFGSDL